MQILAHRGQWRTPDEKNTRTALNRAFRSGFGAETDIRDLDGELVVSHDLPRRGAMPLAVLLNDYVEAGYPGTLALNIKSDGLTAKLQHLLNFHGITRYFCFDMSVPDTFQYLDAGLVAAARLSEYEPEGFLSTSTPVLWVDGFHSLHVTSSRLHTWLDLGYQVCLVSPELHNRPHQPLFRMLATLPDTLRGNDDLMLCTDYCDEARELLV